MKKALLMIALTLLVTAFFAQSSLYDLAYDAPLNDTVASLKAKGFVETGRTDKSVILNGGEDQELPVVNLHLSTDGQSIARWDLEYSIKDNADLPATILASLEALHGEASVVNDYGYNYIWYSADNKALYVTLSFTDNTLFLEYTYGNWDDDDYYYYSDEY